VVVISCVARDDKGVKIFTIGEPSATRKTAARALLRRHRAQTPQLVSWNGKGFDIPVSTIAR